MMKIKFLLGCILACSLSLNLRAQDTAFWFVAPHFTDYVDGSYPSNRPTFLAISNNSYQGADIRITLYNGGVSPIVIQRTIPAGGMYKLDFDNADDIVNNKLNVNHIENPRGSAGSVVTYGIHISSSVRVTAYYMMNGVGSKDIFTLKGERALGTEFYAPMQSDNTSTATVGNAYDQIDIVATEDNTEIEITPKTAIRIGASGSASANTLLSHTLNKGQTLKIMEYAQNSLPSLAGTKIKVLNNKPIAVTVTEDWVNGDTSGDQIVPISSLGTRYIVPRGYMATIERERFYLISTDANTTTEVKVYDNPDNANQYTTISLGTAGTVSSNDKYTFPSLSSGVYAVYVEADKPVYVYQRTGEGEEGAAVLPSVYAIGQTRLSYYQISSAVRRGFLLFRAGKASGFTISYGSYNNLPFGSTNAPAALTPLVVPNVSDWEVARFDLPSTADNQVVTIENTLTPFSFGYISGRTGGGNNSYGYFSAFGDFKFPEGDTTYMCGNTEVLQGGYAAAYKWYFTPPGTLPPTVPPPATTPAISTDSYIIATEEGYYTLVMDQDPIPVMATTYLQRVEAGVISPGDQTICIGTAAAPLSGSDDDVPDGTTYQWQKNSTDPNDPAGWTDISGATNAAAYDPGQPTSTTWYRRGMESDKCGTAYTDPVRVRVSSCTLPVNPHLKVRFRGN